MKNRWSPRWQGRYVEVTLFTVTLKGDKHDTPIVKIEFKEWENKEPIIINNELGLGMKKLKSGGWDNIPHTEIKKEDIRCYHFR